MYFIVSINVAVAVLLERTCLCRFENKHMLNGLNKHTWHSSADVACRYAHINCLCF